MLDDAFNYDIADVSKCDNCGADMVYDPLCHALHCPYCDSKREVVKRVPEIRDYLEECSRGEVQYDGETYMCPNCGGKMKHTSFDTSAECPYCGSTNVVKLEDQKGLKPDSILPFLISKEQAAEQGKKWIKKRLYAPFKLQRQFKIDNFNGVYIPSFAFTTDSYSHYSGRLGERRTRVVGTGKDRRTETYIHWFNVSGSWSRLFQDLSVEASIQIKQEELSKILPYDYNNAEAYNKDYIAGFGSERYDTSLKESFGVAEGIMQATIKREIIRHYGADVVDHLNINSTYSNTKFRYTLLPLWLCAYKYREKGYRFLINGRNGKSTGKYPKSVAKILTTILVLGAIVGVIVWAVVSGQLG